MKSEEDFLFRLYDKSVKLVKGLLMCLVGFYAVYLFYMEDCVSCLKCRRHCFRLKAYIIIAGNDTKKVILIQMPESKRNIF